MFKQDDIVKGTGVGKVLYSDDFSTKIKITEHPDQSVIGRVYSAPTSHFELAEEEQSAREFKECFPETAKAMKALKAQKEYEASKENSSKKDTKKVGLLKRLFGSKK